MQPTRTSVRDVFLLSLLLPAIAAAALQQRQPHHAYPPHRDGLSVADRHVRADESLQTSLSGQRDPFDRHVHNKDRSRSLSRTRTSHNERALATFAPADDESAVRAFPPAPTNSAAANTAGLTSRQPARSLQDWKVEDLILLATVDGDLHAVDRNTGVTKWRLYSEQPMVEIIYHSRNKSEDDLAVGSGRGREDPRWVWIVEPSQDGAVYFYVPGAGSGMQKLGSTVKQLADQAPYASEGEFAFAITAEKRNELYTIDAATGNVLKVLKSSGSMTNQNSCRRVNPLEDLEDDECEPIGTLTIGRTEYVVGIEDPSSDQNGPMCTIRYVEWVPNARDQDLRSQYGETMDKKYIYTTHDGTIYGGTWDESTADKLEGFHRKLEAPVARAFDLVRPVDDLSSGANLVVLPQPVKKPDTLKDLEIDAAESVFVQCNANGSCYAMSEKNYPIIAQDAPRARWYDGEMADVILLPTSRRFLEKFTGVHELYFQPEQDRDGRMRTITAPDIPGIEPPPAQSYEGRDIVPRAESRWDDYVPSVKAFITTVILMGLVGCGALYAQPPRFFSKGQATTIPEMNVPGPIEIPAPKLVDEQLPQTPKVRESEPALETIFPHVPATETTPEADTDADGDLARVATADTPDDADELGKDVGAKPKGHKRGRRGGRKQKEKELAAADAKAKRKASEAPEPMEVISVAASESPQVSGSLQINSLIIHTDRVIGQGSCGTSVFEGSFEGREVAVKRMLSQYYELASQEVSFLQQSDDHANVVRYFCQQKDDHFLYIAVELCQASLFEVWEPEKAKTEERHKQLQQLKLTIQQDTPRALQQLAAGLYHLHNLRIIHRDIKPQNILVAFPKRGQSGGPRLVISDFGLGKNLPENVSTLIDPTGNAGTSGWKAPELISQPRDTDSKHSQSHSYTNGNASDSATGTNGTSGVKRAADIFSLGCLFFWVLTDGIHPYEDENGWHQLRELNIKRDHKKMGVLERWSDAYEPMQLITSMLAHQPEHRPTALTVLNHPFFWSSERRLAFLCDCSDHFEREPRGIVDDGYAGDSYHLSLLEARAPEILNGHDFLTQLDRQFVDTLGRQRKYSGTRVLDLLRALRNKKNHYEDMPDDIKRRVGNLADGGYLGYWCRRFPRLLMACYEVVHEAGVQGNDRFKGYFAVGSA